MSDEAIVQYLASHFLQNLPKREADQKAKEVDNLPPVATF